MWSCLCSRKSVWSCLCGKKSVCSSLYGRKAVWSCLCGKKSVWSCLCGRKTVWSCLCGRKVRCVVGFQLVVGHLCLQDCTSLVCQCYLVFRQNVYDPGGNEHVIGISL